MDIEEPIDPDLLEPWREIDVEYESFQAAMFQHEETAEVIVVEAEAGPFSGESAQYEILLLPHDYEDDTEPKATLEDGLSDADRAIHEAHSIMATDKVDEYADKK
jgi:hypothetical protein